MLSFDTSGALVLLVLVAYALTTYGGIRSPDSEVVLRTCESLASAGSWVIEPLELLPGFGVAPGRGGRFYSVFGPLESLVCAPIYWLGAVSNVAPRSVPPSRYVDDGFKLMLDRQWSGSEPHRIRFVASFLNVILGAVNVLLFYLLIRALRNTTCSRNHPRADFRVRYVALVVLGNILQRDSRGRPGAVLAFDPGA